MAICQNGWNKILDPLNTCTWIPCKEEWIIPHQYSNRTRQLYFLMSDFDNQDSVSPDWWILHQMCLPSMLSTNAASHGCSTSPHSCTLAPWLLRHTKLKSLCGLTRITQGKMKGKFIFTRLWPTKVFIRHSWSSMGLSKDMVVGKGAHQW